MRSRRYSWWTVCLLLSARAALAQSAEIHGVVRDPQQAVVVGARVELIASPSGESTTTVLTDGAGRYRFPGLQDGSYIIEVRGSGFQVVREQVALANGAAAVRDFLLSVARTVESVTVTGRSAAESGYRVGSVTSLGASEAVSLLDTPHTVSVLPGELIEAAQVKSFKEASKFL